MNDNSHEQAMKRGRALRKRLKLQNQMKKAEKKETGKGTGDDVPYTIVPNNQNTVRGDDTNQEYISYNHNENTRRAKGTGDDVPYTVVPNNQNTVRGEDTNQEYISYNHDENIRIADDNTNLGKIEVKTNFEAGLALICSPERRAEESRKRQNYLDEVSSQENPSEQEYQEILRKRKSDENSSLGQARKQTLQKRYKNLHMYDDDVMSDYSTSDDDWD